ncbi:MAG: phospholipase family protein [Myxococcales bacterium]|nr:phospholipase family protein [Myxococcales bacterium]
MAVALPAAPVVVPDTAPAALVVAPVDLVDLLDGGKEAYPRMLEAIAGARATVYLEIYSFSPNGWGAKFVDALVDAAARGVKVRVIIDGWGSLLGGRSVRARLNAAGCECRIYNRFLTLFLFRLRRDHRKILLVDDQTAFLGGINIGDEYAADEFRRGWADLALRIHGPAANRLGKMLRREPVGPFPGGVKFYLSSESGGRKLRKRYLKAFAAAKERLLVAHAYFLPDAGLIRALRNAAKRGVDVRLLLAGNSDVPFAHAATMSLYRRLLVAGVKIFEWTHSVLHAKATTIDHRRFLVGSFNLDPLSLSNLETLVELEDARVVASAEAWIEQHISESRSVTMEECARSAWHRWVGDRLGLVVARAAQLFGRLVNIRR